MAFHGPGRDLSREVERYVAPERKVPNWPRVKFVAICAELYYGYLSGPRTREVRGILRYLREQGHDLRDCVILHCYNMVDAISIAKNVELGPSYIIVKVETHRTREGIAFARITMGPGSGYG